MLLSRRTTTLGLTALLAKPAFAEPADAIAAIERAQKGRVGVFAIDTGSGRTLAYRADERFPMQSTFKGPLAACVLARVDAGQDGLDRPVAYGTKDMVAVSPVTLPHLPAGSMTVGALCQAILERSDNTAANLLLARVGGPAALTAYLRTLGDAVTQVDHYEPVPSHTGPADTTTPRAVAGLARATVLGAALSPASRALLVRWMGVNVPGRRGCAPCCRRAGRHATEPAPVTMCATITPWPGRLAASLS